MDGSAYLADALENLRKSRRLGEAAMAQLDDAGFFAVPRDGVNPVALVVKHLAGNMRSRWTRFLDTDGEKPERRRDAEFELEPGDTRAALLERWSEGWDLALAAIGALRPEDLARTVTIRGEPHTVMQAIQRQLTHYAYHVGQIVLLARTYARREWRSLSIPRGRSQSFEVSRDGTPRRLDP